MSKCALIVDETGQPQEFMAHYWLRHREFWLPFGTPHEAVAFLRTGTIMGIIDAVAVVMPDGREREYNYWIDPEALGIIWLADAHAAVMAQSVRPLARV